MTDDVNGSLLADLRKKLKVASGWTDRAFIIMPDQVRENMVATAKEVLQALEPNPTPESNVYHSTDKGEVWLNYVLAIPMPEPCWQIPQETDE